MKKDYVALLSGVGIWLCSFIQFLGVPKVILFCFMCLDFITGIIVGGYFKNSNKTESGALSSKVGFVGLCKKMLIIVFVIVGVLLDILLGVNYVANGVCFAFICNELISICENAGLMGFSVPNILVNAIDILKEKGESNK